MNRNRLYRRPVVLAATLLSLTTLACALLPGAVEEPSWTPENPTQYAAEVQMVFDAYVVTDAQGNVLPFESDAPFGANAKMRYVLRFWDVGNLGGKGAAAIYRVYTPTEIVAIGDPESYTDEEAAAIYARRGFPTTEVKLHDLTFSGGPSGTFLGTNSESGETISGHLEWNSETREMHALFTEDIKQDYLVTAGEPFYNWP